MLVAGTASVGQEKTPEAVASGAGLRRVEVSVRDTFGKPISGLAAEDFEILENGRPVSAERCDFASVPLDLLFMFDRRSLAGAKEQELLLRELTKNLEWLDDQNRLAGMRLSEGRHQLVAGFTSDFSSVVRALLEPGLGGGDPFAQRLMDALVEAAAEFPRDDLRRRRAILVLSDDLEHGSKVTRRDATEAVLAAGISVYEMVPLYIRSPDRLPGGIAWPRLPWPLPGSHRRKFDSLRPVCEQSGGERLSALPAKELVNSAFASLRETYVISFRAIPGAKRELRSVTVRLAKPAACAHPGAALRFPKGYYYEPAR